MASFKARDVSIRLNFVVQSRPEGQNDLLRWELYERLIGHKWRYVYVKDKARCQRKLDLLHVAVTCMMKCDQRGLKTQGTR